MSDNFDKELEEIMRIVNSDHTKPAKHRQQPPNSLQSPRHSKGNKTAQQLSSEKERHCRINKRKKQCRIRKWTVLCCIIAVLVLLVLLICKGCAGENDTNTALVGVWHYDQYTEYEFDGEGNGCMCLDGNNHFEFTYKAEDGVLYLDFALDYVTDCQYTYTVDGNKLTLIGGEGTAEVGKIYELMKKQ